MFDFVKKASMRRSAAQIIEGSLALINETFIHDVMLIASDKSLVDGDAESNLPGELAATDGKIVAAVKSLQFTLMGPIPICAVREDIFKPLLTFKVPVGIPGVVTKRAFRDVCSAAEANRGREAADLEALWDQVKREVPGLLVSLGRIDGAMTRLPQAIDVRFADL